MENEKKHCIFKKLKPVLIIQHTPYEHAAALGRALQALGIPTFIIYPFRNEPFPSLETIAGIISLGGPMGANDERDHPWILAEIIFLQNAVKKALPTVGICLGGQLIARALGGYVEKHHTPEVGWHAVEILEKGIRDRVLSGVAHQATKQALLNNTKENLVHSHPKLYQWHFDTFHLPNGAELLASSEFCERQAYKIGEKIYGFQFHPEADHQLLHEWLAIEGIEEEIHEVRNCYGNQTIQTIEEQKQSALAGEFFSLSVTTGIADLFSLKTYCPSNEVLRNAIADFHAKQLSVEVTFHRDVNMPLLYGKILTLFQNPGGDFVILKDEDSLLWPLRLDQIKKIQLKRL